jgi:hypothetical protein
MLQIAVLRLSVHDSAINSFVGTWCRNILIPLILHQTECLPQDVRKTTGRPPSSWIQLELVKILKSCANALARCVFNGANRVLGALKGSTLLTHERSALVATSVATNVNFLYASS